jgi:hypothetical protein
VRDAIQTALREGRDAIPPPPAAFFRVNEADRAWVDAMCGPHPIPKAAAFAAVAVIALPDLPPDHQASYPHPPRLA